VQPDVRLKVDGRLYGGWQDIRIQRSIEQIAGQFQLSITERWSGQDTPRPIRPGAACEVLIDGAQAITGYVDDVNISYDASSHAVSVSGRDASGDLVDCSTPIGSGLIGQTLLSAAQRLCAPFCISVTADVDVGGPFSQLLPNPGDSVFTTLDSGARVRAVLLIPDGNGNLLITRASNERIPAMLLLGENVLSASASFSHKDRFRDYTVVGQQAAKEAELFGPSAFHLVGTATDELIDRYRPLIVSSGDLSGNADATQRADWERNVRFGRSQPLQYTVQGWHYEPGKLWPINRLVSVRDEFLGIDADRLITGVLYTLDDNGFRTELTLMPREAFDLIPLPEKGDNFDAL
jgi:prophage tail gpP-like protein